MTPKFFVNRGRRCGPAVIKSFSPEKAWRELDRLIGRRKEDITLPVQIAYGLSSLKIPFTYPVKELFFEEDFEKIRREFKKYGEDNFSSINLDFVKKIRKKLEKVGEYSIEKDISWEKIKEYLQRGLNPVLLVNYDILVERENKQRGHYLTLVGLKGEDAVVMDCGPCDASPNRKISQKKLEKCLMQTPLDFGVVFV